MYLVELVSGSNQVEREPIFTGYGGALLRTYLGRVGGRAGTTRRRARAVPACGAAAQSPSGEQPCEGGKSSRRSLGGKLQY